MTSMIEKEGAIWELTSCPHVLCRLWHLKHDPETPLEILKLCMEPLLMLQASCLYTILIDFICAWAAWANKTALCLNINIYIHTLSGKKKTSHLFPRCFGIKTHLLPAAPHRRWQALANPPTCATCEFLGASQLISQVLFGHILKRATTRFSHSLDRLTLLWTYKKLLKMAIFSEFSH